MESGYDNSAAQGEIPAADQNNEQQMYDYAAYAAQYAQYYYGAYGGMGPNAQMPPGSEGAAGEQEAAIAADPSQQAYDYSHYAGYGAGMAYGANQFGQYPMGRMAARPLVPSQPPQPTRSIWLGSIHQDTTEEELRAEIGMFGIIESIKILPVKNCAFINFSDQNSAINAFNNSFAKIVHGNQIRVGWGRPDGSTDTTTPTAGPPASSPAVKGATNAPSRNLWVGNVSANVTEDMLREEFSKYGTVISIRVLHPKNCAFVNYNSEDEATAARNALQGKMLGDRPLRINFGRVDKADANPNTTPLGTSRSSFGSGPNFVSGGFAASTPGATGTTPSTTTPGTSEVAKDVPVPAPAPEDLGEQTDIEVMARYVARLGSDFELMVKAKKRDNQRFAFMFTGQSGNSYYKWTLYNYKQASSVSLKREREDDVDLPAPKRHHQDASNVNATNNTDQSEPWNSYNQATSQNYNNVPWSY